MISYFLCFLFIKAVVSSVPPIITTAAITPAEYESILKVLPTAWVDAGDGVAGCFVGVSIGIGDAVGVGGGGDGEGVGLGVGVGVECGVGIGV